MAVSVLTVAVDEVSRKAGSMVDISKKLSVLPPSAKKSTGSILVVDSSSSNVKLSRPNR